MGRQLEYSSIKQSRYRLPDISFPLGLDAWGCAMAVFPTCLNSNSMVRRGRRLALAVVASAASGAAADRPFVRATQVVATDMSDNDLEPPKEG